MGISLFHNMKFNGTILEEQAAAYAAHSHPRGRRSVQYMPMEAPMMMMQPVLVNPPRRLSAVAGGHAELAVSGLSLPPNVIRLPRGPDKSKGFQRWCKTRMQPQAPTQSQAPNPNPAPTQPRKSRAIPIVAPPAEDL